MNPKNCERRKKRIPRRFTKVNVIKKPVDFVCILFVYIKLNHPHDLQKDLDFKSKFNSESSKFLRETKFSRYFLYMSDKACMDIFQGSIL